MKKYKANVVSTVKVCGQIYNYGEEFTVPEEQDHELKDLIKTGQIIRVYD